MVGPAYEGSAHFAFQDGIRAISEILGNPDPVQPTTNPLRGGGLPGGLRANTGPKSCRLSVQDEGRKTVVEKRTANGSATENTTGLPQLVGVTPQTPWGEPRIGKTAALPAA